MEEKITKKEKRFFWVGLSAGIVGSFVTNILTNYIFEFKNEPTLINLLGMLIFTLIFFILLVYLNKQIKKNK